MSSDIRQVGNFPLNCDYPKLIHQLVVISSRSLSPCILGLLSRIKALTCLLKLLTYISVHVISTVVQCIGTSNTRLHNILGCFMFKPLGLHFGLGSLVTVTQGVFSTVVLFPPVGGAVMPYPSLPPPGISIVFKIIFYLCVLVCLQICF